MAGPQKGEKRFFLKMVFHSGDSALRYWNPYVQRSCHWSVTRRSNDEFAERFVMADNSPGQIIWPRTKPT
jgi:hypothetical protein